jgi:hypothetical protein
VLLPGDRRDGSNPIWRETGLFGGVVAHLAGHKTPVYLGSTPRRPQSRQQADSRARQPAGAGLGLEVGDFARGVVLNIAWQTLAG